MSPAPSSHCPYSVTAAAAQLPPLLSDRGAVGFGLEILLLDDLKAEICAPVPAPSEGELYTHRCTELLAAAEAEVQAGCIYLLGKAPLTLP